MARRGGAAAAGGGGGGGGAQGGAGAAAAAEAAPVLELRAARPLAAQLRHLRTLCHPALAAQYGGSVWLAVPLLHLRCVRRAAGDGQLVVLPGARLLLQRCGEGKALSEC